MEQFDLKDDEVLRNMMQQVPLDSPSEDFLNRVMSEIQASPSSETVKKPFYTYLQSFLPYGFLVLILTTVVLTSDLPLMNWFPGNSFFTNTVMPYAEMFWTSLGKLFSSRYVTFGLLISVSAGLLFTLDQYFGKRFSRHQNAA